MNTDPNPLPRDEELADLPSPYVDPPPSRLRTAASLVGAWVLLVIALALLGAALGGCSPAHAGPPPPDTTCAPGWNCFTSLDPMDDSTSVYAWRTIGETSRGTLNFMVGCPQQPGGEPVVMIALVGGDLFRGEYVGGLLLSETRIRIDDRPAYRLPMIVGDDSKVMAALGLWSTLIAAQERVLIEVQVYRAGFTVGQINPDDLRRVAPIMQGCSK